MSLDPSYIEYPRRKRGMDHDLYPWSNLFARAPITWPHGRPVSVAIVVNVEWFPILPADVPFRAPGHMQTAYPDYRHYTSREYGTRVGLYRLLDAFEAQGIRASCAVNGAIATRYPELIADIVAGGHEIVAHSTDMNGTIATGLAEADERALIVRSLDSIEGATGRRPRGWMSIARSQSWNTPRLLTELGLDYMCDWVNDDLPYAMTTEAGSIINVPVNHELSDRQIITVQQQSADSYVEQIQDALTLFEGEAEHFGGRLLALNVSPYIMGLPYRIAAVERLLAWLAARDGVGFVTTAEAASAVA
jgi:allantoinase